MIHDKLPRGMQNHITHSLHNLERFAQPLEDTLETLRQLAPPLFVGLEDEVRAMDSLLEKLKTRWAAYQANDAWMSDAEATARLAQASGKTNGKELAGK